MPPKYRAINRNMPLLLPVDLREWVPEDDRVHFVIEAVSNAPRLRFEANGRGTGSAQYPPKMLLSLLIYCYANGVFSSRRIEAATYRDVAVRYLTGDTHPDHSTICAFRQQNSEAIHEAFLGVLKLAREMRILKVGTISVDGTQIAANASKHKSVTYDRAGELDKQLELDIAVLMEQAESADAADEEDGKRLPKEIARREKLRLIKPPDDTPGGGEPINLTDAESRLMRKNKQSEYKQAYNAQAAVDADGTQLIVANHVTPCASDANERLASVDAVTETQGKP